MKVSTFVIVSIVAFTSVYFVATHNRPNPQTRQYSQAQWMQMITQSQHQPTAIWQGVSAGEITRRGGGCGGGLLHFEDTSAHILEHHASDLLINDPLYFLPALLSKDKRVIQTGLYVYSRYRKSKPTQQQKLKLAEAYRSLLDHKDTPLRAAGISWLRGNHMMTVADIEKGLSDQTRDVRFVTSFGLTTFFDPSPIYAKDGKIHKGTVERADELVEIKRKLAPILLEHLNDTHFETRATMAGTFRFMLRRYELTESSTTRRPYDKIPKYIDWRRESWYKREETKEIWTKWWEENGEEALKFAHPPQK